MVYIAWLADAARTTGYRVVEVAGWRSRGHGAMRLVEGVVGHHTATPARASGDYPSLNVVTNGRSDLAGPLAHLGLGRDGTVYVIAAGVGWHAGASNWAGFVDLNDEFVGVEAESPGDGTWTVAQRDCYPKLVGALLRYMNRPKERYGGHKDVCRPRGRKIDPAGIDTVWMQNTAAKYITGGGGAAPGGEDDMPYSPEDIALFAYRGTVSALQDAAYHPDSHVAKAVAALDKKTAVAVWSADLIHANPDSEDNPMWQAKSALGSLVQAMRAGAGLDVDEAELARELAPTLAEMLPRIPDDQMAQLVEQIPEETRRRFAAALNQEGQTA
jgi:hypothetical protein